MDLTADTYVDIWCEIFGAILRMQSPRYLAASCHYMSRLADEYMSRRGVRRVSGIEPKLDIHAPMHGVCADSIDSIIVARGVTQYVTIVLCEYGVVLAVIYNIFGNVTVRYRSNMQMINAKETNNMIRLGISQTYSVADLHNYDDKAGGAPEYTLRMYANNSVREIYNGDGTVIEGSRDIYKTQYSEINAILLERGRLAISRSREIRALINWDYERWSRPISLNIHLWDRIIDIIVDEQGNAAALTVTCKFMQLVFRGYDSRACEH